MGVRNGISTNVEGVQRGKDCYDYRLECEKVGIYHKLQELEKAGPRTGKSIPYRSYL